MRLYIWYIRGWLVFDDIETKPTMWNNLPKSRNSFLTSWDGSPRSHLQVCVRLKEPSSCFQNFMTLLMRRWSHRKLVTLWNRAQMETHASISREKKTPCMKLGDRNRNRNRKRFFLPDFCMAASKQHGV